MVDSTLTKIQSKTWTSFPTSNTLKTFQTHSLNHSHLPWHGRKLTPPPVLCCANILLTHGNATPRATLRRTYTTIPTTRLRRVKSTNIFNVGSRRRAWRRNMTTSWRKKPPLCVSNASKTWIASRNWWLVCQMVRLSGSGNNTPSRIWNGMIITNAQSNTGVETSSKAWDVWCGSHCMPSIFSRPLSIALSVIHHQNTSKQKCTLRTCGGRHM